MSEQVVIVHPDDVNMADAKALAAMYDTSVVGSPYVPRGQMFLAAAPPPPGRPVERTRGHEEDERE